MTQRVLIVDDSAVARAVMERIIAATDRYLVIASVSTASAALAVLARERVQFVLLDVQMPGVDGLTALPGLIAAGQGANVLVVSGQAGEGVEEGPMAPDLVAPMVAYLAHEDCPVSGEIYAAGAGRFARIFIASTPGYVHPGPAPTVEDVAGGWAAINDEAGYYLPADLMDWSATFMAHLR